MADSSFSFDGSLDTTRMPMEDFVATCPQVFLAVGEELLECDADQRARAVWLDLPEPIDAEFADTLVLCFPHSTGLYRFNVDVLDISEEHVVVTRSVHDPLGRRVSVRGQVSVGVALTPAERKGAPTCTGRTRDLSRLGMLVETTEILPHDSKWDCELKLWDDESIHLDGTVMRTVEAAGDKPGAYGIKFQDVPMHTQRKVLDFVLENSDLSAAAEQ